MKKPVVAAFLWALFPAVAFGQATSYRLERLTYEGFSQKQTLGKIRQYIKFKNALGAHTVIYEDDPAWPSSREIQSLRQAVGPGLSCSLTISCEQKAFCTENCQNMYYEMSNQPPLPSTGPGASSPTAAEMRTQCRILAFDCSRLDLAPAPTGKP